MAILEHELRSFQSKLTGIHRRLLTLEAYTLLVNSGVLGEDRLELIEGELVEMAPIGDGHAAITDGIGDLLRSLFGPGFYVRHQSPILLGTDPRPSVPQPDVVIAKGSWRDYLNRKPEPEDIVLLVETAESSLEGDRSVKATLYAAAGIPEYWIVNLVDSRLEVYRDPSDAGYAIRMVVRPGESIEPLSAPDRSIAIADFLQ